MIISSGFKKILYVFVILWRGQLPWRDLMRPHIHTHTHTPDASTCVYKRGSNNCGVKCWGWSWCECLFIHDAEAGKSRCWHLVCVQSFASPIWRYFRSPGLAELLVFPKVRAVMITSHLRDSAKGQKWLSVRKLWYDNIMLQNCVVQINDSRQIAINEKQKN